MAQQIHSPSSFPFATTSIPVQPWTSRSSTPGQPSFPPEYHHAQHSYSHEQHANLLPATQNQKPTPGPRYRDQNRSGPVFPWRFQLLASILSILSFASIILVAVLYRDRPLSDWPIKILSINSVVAGLTTILKGVLLIPIADSISQAKWNWFSSPEGRPLQDLETIDEVSRGIWGSAIWFLKHPLPTNIITIGAVLTVLASGLDLFSQQIIGIDTRQVVNQTGTANTPWVQNLSSISEASWYSAIYTGFFGGTVDDLPVNCPSGNCTWDHVVPSIGVCGECMDITKYMAEDWMTCESFLCNYTTGGLFPKSMEGPAPNTNITWDRDINPYPGWIQTTSLGSAPTFKIYDLLNISQFSQGMTFGAMNFEVIDVPLLEHNIESSLGWAKFGEPSVTQCGFWFCMQRYSTEVKLGRQTQSHVDGPAGVGRVASNTGITSATRELFFEDAPEFNMQNRTFSVSGIDALPPMYGALTGDLKIDLGKSFDLDMIKVYSSPVMKGWYTAKNGGNVTDWVSHFAKSLTNLVRRENMVPLDQDVYAGVAFSQETYIQVSWPWVVLPTMLLLTGLGLFTWNMVANTVRMKQGSTAYGAWVNGLLVLLLSGVDERTKEQAKGGYSSSGRLSNAIGNRKVRLGRQGEGPVFSSVGPG